METREMTFGEKLVGLTFNPSGDPKVQRAKELCAELADLLADHLNDDKNKLSTSNDDLLRKRLAEHTLGEILNAQMNVVKVLTFKY
jgi:hypothetical protein